MIVQSHEFLGFAKDKTAVEKAFAQVTDPDNPEPLEINLSGLPGETLIKELQVRAMAQSLMQSRADWEFALAIHADDPEAKETIAQIGGDLGRLAVESQPLSKPAAGELDVQRVHFGVRTGTGIILGGFGGAGVGMLLESGLKAVERPLGAGVVVAATLIGMAIGGGAGSGIIAELTGNVSEGAIGMKFSRYP